MWVRALASCAGQVVRESASRRLLLSLWNRDFVAVWPVPGLVGTGNLRKREILRRFQPFLSRSSRFRETAISHFHFLPTQCPKYLPVF